MTGYKMNFATKTLTITKAFAAKAMLPNTEEANLILNMRSMIPDLKISYRTHTGYRPNPFKGLTYSKMEKYIGCHANAAELFTAFLRIKEIAAIQPNPHNYVCRWFLMQFPDYRGIPTLDGDKIAAVRAITTHEEVMQAADTTDKVAA